MRLKTLELHGYKSFATKTVFHFDAGVTAVVGPNGSGKSNVADAVRWVLGEQSYAALRGKKTEDMIFSGSDGRPRLGMASATLVFDNSDGWLPVDFAEVTVTRRAFRDGQNEYLLNGNRVRLRDINELLAASGLSRRTYTHIGQGMVDAALSLRSEERRVLFEEAAGITLHHSKRADTLAKLDATHDNVLRLHDIVAEIEPRLRYLERQAERANAHQVVNANLKDQLRTWYGYRWGVVQQHLRETRMEESRNQTALDAQTLTLEETSAQMTQLRGRQNELRARLSEWHRQSSQLHIQAEAMQRELAVGEERGRLLNAQHSEMSSEIEALEAARLQTEAKSGESRAALVQMDADLEAVRSRAGALKTQTDAHRARRQQLLDQQAQSERRVRQLADRIAGHGARLAQSEEQHMRLGREVDQASTAQDGHAQTATTARQQLQEKEHAREQLDLALGQLRAQREERLANVKRLEHLAGELKEEINTHRRHLETLRARHDLLSKMQRDMVGYYEGVRTVLAAAGEGGNLRGVLGTVTQLLSVPRELETAIDTALGGHLQDIVVERWENAEAAINHLKATHSGRATFLPLDVIRPPRQLTPPQTAGVLGVGSDLVLCEEHLRPVARLLLGNTIVVEDLPTARQVHKAMQGGFQIVTLAGDLVRSGGSVSGGSVSRDKGSGGLLARQREWAELPSAIQEQQAAEEALLRRLEVHRAAQSEQQSGLDDLARRSAEVEGDRAAIQQQHAALTREAERAEQAAGWQQELLQRTQAERARLEQLATQMTAEIDHLKSEQAAAQSESRDLAEQAAAFAVETLLTELSQAQTELATAAGRVSSQRATLEGQLAALREAENRLNGKRRRAEEVSSEGTALEARLAEQRTRATELTLRISEMGSLIAPAEEDLARLETDHGALESEQRRQLDRLHRLETDHGRARLDLTRRQDELNLLRRQMEEDLGLVEVDLSDSPVDQPPLPLHPLVSHLPVVTEVPDDLEEEIRHLRVQLGQLGSVNLNAPQEYEETRQRHEFLSGQINDLEQAAANLRQVIAELDRVMEGSLLSTFHAVAGEFKTYFKQLFNGGDADLVLTNPDDLTTTGIDVVARPPGKRARALSMLSGGERALTAASLIFALLKVSPTPFCTLDEVDAMLDEANVGRFREVLEGLAQKTQFIVITHNRRTVEAAKTIYGVSMGEDTASRVVSLRIEDIDRK